MANNVFTISGLSFAYGRKRIFEGLDLAFAEGVVTTLIGANGSGKSTLFNLMTKNLKPSAGSVFKRPEGHFAGALIEQCGLKGTRVGGAEVSEKHAGFIINRGGATCADVLSLISLIQETVLRETGIMLECEVKRMGEE